MLRGQKVILRAYKESDIEKAYEFINDYEVKKLLVINAPFPSTYWEEEKWVKGQTEGNDMTYNFAIEDIETGKYIGGLGINECNLKNRNCTIGIMIGDKDYWGKGFGSDGLKTLVDFIFNEMNMHKIKLSVFSFNSRAIACYEKVGFKQEAVLKEEIFREGKYYDEIKMCIMAKDYFN